MAYEKKPEFTVNDRRKFTFEGDLRSDSTSTEEKSPAAPVQTPEPAPAAAAQQQPAQPEMPPPPSTQQHQEQAQRYQQSARDLDSHLQRELDAEGRGRKASDFEITFEKFVASLYMTALMQLGLVQEQGAQPTADLIGARQTIDTLSLLSQKTRGNLSSAEEHLLSNCLYELRMAYVELTNALTNPPAGKMPPDPAAGLK